MRKLTTLLFLIVLFSCSSSDNSSVSDFQGIWSGQYTGTGGPENSGDNGVFSVTVDSNGNITGSATSIPYEDTYQLTGSVNPSGALALTFGSSSLGGTFSGNMNLNGTGSGTWINNIATPPFNGNWTATKQ